MIYCYSFHLLPLIQVGGGGANRPVAKKRWGGGEMKDPMKVDLLNPIILTHFEAQSESFGRFGDSAWVILFVLFFCFCFLFCFVFVFATGAILSKFYKSITLIRQWSNHSSNL